MTMFDEERLSLAAFDISTAERIYKSNRPDLRGAAILNGVKKREEEEKQAFINKL